MNEHGVLRFLRNVPLIGYKPPKDTSPAPPREEAPAPEGATATV